MSTRPCIPALTNGDLGVQQRQADFINKDLSSIQSLDYNKPFATLEDAAKQLLPFHLLAAQDPAEGDWEEAEDSQGAGLLASRRDAWDHICQHSLTDRRKRAEALEQQIYKLHQQVFAPQPAPSAVDLFQLELMQKEVATAQLQRLLPRPVLAGPPPLAMTAHASQLMRAGGHVAPRPHPPGVALLHPGAGGWPGVTSPRAVATHPLPPGILVSPTAAAGTAPAPMQHQGVLGAAALQQQQQQRLSAMQGHTAGGIGPGAAGVMTQPALRPSLGQVGQPVVPVLQQQQQPPAAVAAMQQQQQRQ